MHANNIKTVAHWTANTYAEAYRDYINNWSDVENWFSSIMPEDATMDDVLNFRSICAKFHNLGF